MIAVSPIQGKFTSLLATLSSAKNVLEIGTLGGYSTIWFAEAVKGRGKVTSIEIDPHRREVAIENLRFAGVRVPEEVDIKLGAALDVLPTLKSEIEQGLRDPFDFIFVDADWENQANYFEYGVQLTAKGGVIYVDNAVRNLVESESFGKGDPENATDLVARAGKDDRVDSVVMQTVGAKEYDGFLLAIVR
jgi:predicted O-methyltransferase YrrM